MAGVNKVFLVGRLGKDPESRSFQNGGKVVNFTMATSETWNDRSSGERREKTEWHNIVIRNEKLGEIAEKYLKKGREVCIEGSIQSRKYTDNAGQEKYITEIVVGPFRGELTLLGGREEGASGASPGSGSGGYERGGGSERGGGAQRPGGGDGRGDGRGAGRGGGSEGGPSWDSAKGGGDLDDEIPF